MRRTVCVLNSSLARLVLLYRCGLGIRSDGCCFVFGRFKIRFLTELRAVLTRYSHVEGTFFESRWVICTCEVPVLSLELRIVSRGAGRVFWRFPFRILAQFLATVRREESHSGSDLRYQLCWRKLRRFSSVFEASAEIQPWNKMAYFLSVCYP